MKKNIVVGILCLCFGTFAFAEDIYTTLERGSSFVSRDKSGVEWVAVTHEAARYLYDHPNAQDIVDVQSIPNVENIIDRIDSYNFRQLNGWLCGKVDRSGIGQRIADFFLLRNEGIGGYYYTCQTAL